MFYLFGHTRRGVKAFLSKCWGQPSLLCRSWVLVALVVMAMITALGIVGAAADIFSLVLALLLLTPWLYPLLSPPPFLSCFSAPCSSPTAPTTASSLSPIALLGPPDPAIDGLHCHPGLACCLCKGYLTRSKTAIRENVSQGHEQKPARQMEGSSWRKCSIHTALAETQYI